MFKQLPLRIQLRDDATFNNFFPGENHELIHCLQKTITKDNPNQNSLIYLWGAKGSGRSHLLQACCHHAGENNLTSIYLSLAQTAKFSPSLLEDLENLDVICLDNIDTIATKPLWQEALFHCYNRAMAANTKLIVAANTAPTLLQFPLRDLISRLSAGITFQVTPLTDEQKIAALQLRAKLRGMVLAKPVAKFLLHHYQRDTAVLFNVLDKLDQASLIAKKKPSIKLLKETLQI